MKADSQRSRLQRQVDNGRLVSMLSIGTAASTARTKGVRRPRRRIIELRRLEPPSMGGFKLSLLRLYDVEQA